MPAFQGALSGFSDLPMRRVARTFGCGYAMNEVVLDEEVLRPGKLQQQILHVADDDHPVAGQLLGATVDVTSSITAMAVTMAATMAAKSFVDDGGPGAS